MADNIINRFLQLNDPNIARQTRNMSYADAFKTENPFSKSYQGYSPGYKGADKVGLGGYLKQGFKSLGGSFQPGSNVGGATPLTRKVAQDAARLGSKAVGLGRTALGGPFGIASMLGTGIGYGVDQIARATNTPEEYEAMKEKARSDYMGTGYFDDVDISQDAPVQGLNLNDYEQSITANEPMDIEDFLGTSTPQDLGFIGMAPGIKEAVAPVGITDRGRSGAFANPGEMGAYEMIGGTPVAVGDVLGRQQALEKADFYEEPTQGINYDALGILGTIGGLLTGSTALKGLGMFGNIKSGRTGRALDGISRGLGSLGSGMSSFNRAMRGYNPYTGRTNTQAEYEQARANRSLNNRLDYMTKRKAAGKSYSKKKLAEVQAQINNRINQGERDALGDKNKSVDYGITGGPTRTDIDVADGGAESGGGGKIVCTMMNERYGFGSFRNKIWMKFHEHHGPEYQKGYHAIFLPLVKIAKGEGKINTAVRKVLEHMGRHVTADMFKIMKGKKRDTLGRIYRAIFEPACHIIGKIKSALGRG
jgi:hypothetical protein